MVSMIDWYLTTHDPALATDPKVAAKLQTIETMIKDAIGPEANPLKAHIWLQAYGVHFELPPGTIVRPHAPSGTADER
jgi:hypothetical protein